MWDYEDLYDSRPEDYDDGWRDDWSEQDTEAMKQAWGSTMPYEWSE